MKWIALSLIALGALLFADHRNGTVPLGLGLILFAYWYFAEREPYVSPPSEKDNVQQSSFDKPLVENSTSFDQADFLPFLQQLQRHFSGGFSDHVISHIASLAAKMKHNEEKSMEYLIIFCGKPSPLKIGLFKDDAEEITVYFHSPKPVSDLIDSEMDSFFSAREM